MSRGKVGDIEYYVNEDNHDEYQKGRGENEEKNPDNIETAGFNLQRKLEGLKMPFSLLLLSHKGYLHPLMEEEAQHFVRCISCNLECYYFLFWSIYLFTHHTGIHLRTVA